MANKLKLATPEKVKALLQEAADWYNGMQINMFADCGYITRTSVAEFLANRMGLTLYEKRVGEELEKDKS